MKKILLLVCAMLALSISAFAADEVYFCEQALTLSGPGQRVVTLTSSGSGVYFYAESRGTDAVALYAISASDTETVHRHFVSIGGGSSTETNFTDWNSFSSGYDVYRIFIDSYDGGYTLDPEITPIPSGTTPADIAQAFLDFLSNPPNPVPMKRFTIPRGNVAYIQVPTSQTLTLTSSFMRYSDLIWVQYGPWGDTGQRVGTASSLPTSSTVFPLAGSSGITWSKKPPVDLLGRTKTGTATVSASPSQYLVIYNPTWSYLTENLREGVGASILVEGTFSSVRVFPLSQELTISNAVDGLSSSSNDGYTSYYDATFTEDGNAEWTNQDGEVTQPVNGGQNMQSDPISAADLIDNIVGLLKKIVENIESVFTFGYEAIQQLAGLMSGFVSVFSSLYNWLPAEVHAALISAVSVAIMIGVFKVFL